MHSVHGKSVYVEHRIDTCAMHETQGVRGNALSHPPSSPSQPSHHYAVVAKSGIGPIQRDVYFSGLGFLKKRISWDVKDGEMVGIR